MDKITSKRSLSRLCLLSFLLLCGLFASEQVFSAAWNRNFTRVEYNPDENTITFKFIVYDWYLFIPIIVKVIMTCIDQYYMLPHYYHDHRSYATYFYFFIDFIVLLSIFLTKYLHTHKSCNDANYTDKLIFHEKY